MICRPPVFSKKIEVFGFRTFEISQIDILKNELGSFLGLFKVSWRGGLKWRLAGLGPYHKTP